MITTPRQPGSLQADAVLIPALNCGATIRVVVSAARCHISHVLVVSDGSTDSTVAEARAAGASVLTHDRPRGKGAALLTGMLALADCSVKRVVTMDGDGQHLAEAIPTLLRAADAAPGALIIGARLSETGGVAPMRVFGNRFANRWVEIACGERLPDTQSGFRVYPLPQVLALRVRARHFAFETEVLIRAVRAGVAIHSVPIRVYNPPIATRVSHFRPVVDTVRIIFVVLGLIFRVW